MMKPSFLVFSTRILAHSNWILAGGGLSSWRSETVTISTCTCKICWKSILGHFVHKLWLITYLSKCRIGDVFLFSLSVWDVWRGWWSDDLLLVCSDIVKILVSCLFLRGNNLLYRAYFKVQFQYQTKVGLDTKLSEFCLKSLLKYLPTDWPEWHEIVMWDIWFYT